MRPACIRPCVWLLTACGLLPTVLRAADGPIDFNRDVRALLSNKCFFCHGPDADERKGGTDGLRFDTPEGIVADLGGYAAVVPGDPAASALIERVSSDDDSLVMPPPESGSRLSPQEVETLRRWIAEGAKYPRHWSYVPPARPAVPDVPDPVRCENAIDRFVAARLARRGLRPAPEADRTTLVRRVTLDLTGLPPTPGQVAAFVADGSPDAYGRLVDRLLADPAYGEQQARKWLDLARYADSAGYADDPPRTIWGYRDAVIRAMNAGTPFDEFTLDQLAGDLRPDPTPDALLATAFHRNTLTNNEGGTDDEEFRTVAVVDRVNTTAAVWMGTTMACAQCHTHKYDPITQAEYFRFYDFFNQSADADRRDESPLLELYTDAQKRRKAAWEAERRSLEERLRTPTPESLAGFPAWEAAVTAEPRWTPLRPTAVATKSAATAEILDDASVRVAAGGETDVYTVTLPAGGSSLAALRLEALTDDALPGGGPGHGGGNFVVSRVTATATPPATERVPGRFVRVELPGKGKMLSLAEVQVFDGADNVAGSGVASQSSTDFGGPAGLAIDGDTDGDFRKAKSTTHTAASDDPWWELDLKASRPIDRVVLWNRTDGAVGGRLAGAKLTVLDEKRNPLFERVFGEAPAPSAEASIGGGRPAPFVAAFADFEQSGFPASSVVAGAGPETGWAISPRQGKSHSLTLLPTAPLDLPTGSTLTVVIEQTSQFASHTLGRFRLSTTPDSQAAERVAIPQDVLAALAVPAGSRTDAQRSTLTNHYLAAVAPELKSARDRLAAVVKSLGDLKPGTTVPVMRDLPPESRRTTRVQRRGNYADLGETVTAGVPEAFGDLPADGPQDRLALARWLVDESNPLTARVAANRLWMQFFGAGIVRTPEEFGSQGEPPTHPDLLDWLATELVRIGWDVKAIQRLIVTSATYRQAAGSAERGVRSAESASATPHSELRTPYSADPDNRWLARGPRFRLPAETIRDQALAASGLLSRTMYGEPVRPPQPSLGLTAAFGGSTDWKTSEQEGRYRRGLYTTWRRSNPYPSMAAFDAPNREVCTLRRDRTNTPLQALVTLNDPAYVEAAQALARRMAAVEGSPADKAAAGFRLCVSRDPGEPERDRVVALYESVKADYATDPKAATAMATDPLGPLPAGADPAGLAAWTVVANVLLNLDETLTRP